MPFKEGNQYGKLTKRGENRVTKEVKQKLAKLLDDTIKSIDPDDLRTAQKIKFIVISVTAIKILLTSYIANQSACINEPQVVCKARSLERRVECRN